MARGHVDLEEERVAVCLHLAQLLDISVIFVNVRVMSVYMTPWAHFLRLYLLFYLLQRLPVRHARIVQAAQDKDRLCMLSVRLYVSVRGGQRVKKNKKKTTHTHIFMLYLPGRLDFLYWSQDSTP